VSGGDVSSQLVAKNAHDITTKCIVRLMHRLIASKYYLKEHDQLAMDCVTLRDAKTGIKDRYEPGM
jgi:hypothetical protein